MNANPESDTSDPTNPFTKLWRDRKGLVIGAAALGFVLLFVIIFVMVNVSVTNAGNKKEAGLNAQYENNQNYLSDCIVRIRETAGVAEAQADAFDSIIANAIAGRDYAGGGGINPDALFSAIVEQYPDLSGLQPTFTGVLNTVNDCRTNFRDQQAKLLSQIEEYNKWRTGSLTVRVFGDEFPSNNLVVHLREETLTGDAALEHMTQVVVVLDASEAFDTGELEPIDPFGDD